jgi:hypothetical protein
MCTGIRLRTLSGHSGWGEIRITAGFMSSAVEQYSLHEPQNGFNSFGVDRGGFSVLPPVSVLKPSGFPLPHNLRFVTESMYI